MRTYLIDKKHENEYVFDITKAIRHSSNLVEFEMHALKNDEIERKEQIFVRKLAGQYFFSKDNVYWEKIARQDLPKRMTNIDSVLDVYRGYKPSGLSDGGDGGLLTQMPGKIVKIKVDVGDKVKAGQTVIILEAMKMENEIKCSVEGVVKSINVKEGDALDQGVLMMEIE